MATALENVVVGARDIRGLGHWWADALGWSVTFDTPEEVDVAPVDRLVDLTFAPVPGPKVGKNRVHLDLRSGSAAEQAVIVDRLLAAGATHADVGQHPDATSSVPWVVLADPEGNEFCVLEPRTTYADTGALAAVAVDAADPASLAAFWAEATGWPVRHAGGAVAGLRHPGDVGPWLEFVRVTEPRRGRNRVHLDVLVDPDGDRDAEVARLVGLGARVLDEPSYRGLPWTVLTDPEGNEFCVLPPRPE